MPPHQQVHTLVRIGLLPSQAEQIVASAEARRHQLLDLNDLVSAAAVDDAAVAEARLWFQYSPTVPNSMRRMPEARQLP